VTYLASAKSVRSRKSVVTSKTGLSLVKIKNDQNEPNENKYKEVD